MCDNDVFDFAGRSSRPQFEKSASLDIGKTCLQKWRMAYKPFSIAKRSSLKYLLAACLSFLFALILSLGYVTVKSEGPYMGLLGCILCKLEMTCMGMSHKNNWDSSIRMQLRMKVTDMLWIRKYFWVTTFYKHKIHTFLWTYYWMRPNVSIIYRCQHCTCYGLMIKILLHMA